MPVAREVRAAASARSDVFPVSEGEALPFVDKRYVLPSRSPLLAKRRSFGPAPCHRLPCDTKKNGWMTEKPDRCPRSSGRVPYLTGQGDTARATGRPSGFCSRSQGTRYVGGSSLSAVALNRLKPIKKDRGKSPAASVYPVTPTGRPGLIHVHTGRRNARYRLHQGNPRSGLPRSPAAAPKHCSDDAWSSGGYRPTGPHAGASLRPPRAPALPRR